MKKSQSSVEFLITFGIGFSLIIILSGIFLTYSEGAKENLDKQQIQKIGQEIIFNVEKIYFLGEGNRVTLNTRFPDNIENFTIYHSDASGEEFDYLNITYLNNGQFYDEIFTTNELYTRFNCTSCYHTGDISYYNLSDFSGGNKEIRITSKGEYVSIDFFKGSLS